MANVNNSFHTCAMPKKALKRLSLRNFFIIILMSFFSKIPKSIRLAFAVMAMLLLCMTLYRIFFFFHYRADGKAFSGSMMLMGLRFDLRVVAAIGLGMFIVSSIINPFKNKKSKLFWLILLTIIFLIFLMAYGSDFYYYDYLKQRLSAAIISFAKDAAISAKMMWETYPLIKIFFALGIVLFLFVWIVKHLLKKITEADFEYVKKWRIIYSTLFVLLTAIGVFGKIGQYPLRWSDAFTLTDEFKAHVALNPFQSFFSSLSFKNSGYDIKKVREAYPTIANYFSVKDTNTKKFNLDRTYSFAQTSDTISKPNVVIVICESFSAYKSSMFGNGLNPTPYFNSMCHNGIFFERCFTPAFGTARGVWATLSGIPDVEDNKTASRNPAAVNQHTIMNDFKGYEKFYFLGGSTTWANIRGLLTNNIDGLKIYEEENFKAAKVDVWGISDKNLFLEANKVFATQTKPFVSVIQTADNHRPYTIPTEDLNAFKKVEYPKDTLAKYGFDDNGQLNAFRYTDFSFATFIEAAKKEKYFANTIFVFVGDHGLRGNAGNMFPQSFTKQGILAEHVPLLFYAPQLLKPSRIKEPASQLDIFPSVAYLAKQSHTNTTLGNNLFDTATNKNRFAFIADPDMKTIGIVNNEFHFAKNLKTGSIDFVSVQNNDAVLMNNRNDSIKNAMSVSTNAFYNMAKYLLLNNKKK
jgi:phosphoglycerol transferase MdoB-like AlkP superfamily enzyme